MDKEELIRELKDIRDLALTNSIPDVLGITDQEEWNRYKLLKISSKMVKLINKLETQDVR